MVVDDYGHHPVEIRATLSAARNGWPERRLVVAFQPHRYSRTKELFNDFVTCFYDADVLILTDIYAASEQPIPGVSSEHLADEVRRHGQRDVTYVADRTTLPDYLAGVVKEGDIVITLGAGNIWQAGEELVNKL
jgi:UDP-N-acetylmuramate--alanine ligase